MKGDTDSFEFADLVDQKYSAIKMESAKEGETYSIQGGRERGFSRLFRRIDLAYREDLSENKEKLSENQKSLIASKIAENLAKESTHKITFVGDNYTKAEAAAWAIGNLGVLGAPHFIKFKQDTEHSNIPDYIVPSGPNKEINKERIKGYIKDAFSEVRLMSPEDVEKDLSSKELNSCGATNIMHSLQTSSSNVPQTSVSKASSDPLKAPSEKSLA
jgi:hypothetical protein